MAKKKVAKKAATKPYIYTQQGEELTQPQLQQAKREAKRHAYEAGEFVTLGADTCEVIGVTQHLFVKRGDSIISIAAHHVRPGKKPR